MTNEQYQQLLQGIEQTLRAVHSSKDYQKLEEHKYFATSNNLNLADAIQALYEVRQGLKMVGLYDLTS